MNKKTNRSSLRASTVKPVASIAPSATLAQDGELPLAASNDVSAPEPLAAHDVLQAALAPREGDLPDGALPDGADRADGAAAMAQPAGGTSADTTAAAIAPEQDIDGKKPGRKPGKAAQKAQAAPVKPAGKAVKEKFVKCTFALPESEMLVLDAMKKTYKANGVALKKSQLLRAALLALADVDPERLAQLVAQLPAAPVAGKKKK